MSTGTREEVGPRTATPRDPVEDAGMRPETAEPGHKGHLGLIVTASMLTGLLAALILALLVFGGATEPVISGVVLVSFALGWAMLAWLSRRRTDQPQQWALVPAVFMGVLGVAHLVLRPSDGVLRAFGWVWPIPVAALALWTIIQSRRSLHNWSRRAVLYPVLALLLLAAVGGGYETVREAHDKATYAMPGRLIDVGGHKLHISCTGSGSPTVILEAGLGEPAVMMSGWIQPGVATTTRVCVYDRAGKGWSESAGKPQDGLAITADLHTLLSRAQVDPPYVLVGHSSGGVYVQVYAAQYPEEVAGMVLLDSQPPDVFTKIPDYPSFYDLFRKVSGLFPSLARLGVMRLGYSFAAKSLPPEARAEERAFWSTARQSRSLRDEFLELRAALTQAQALTSLDGKPLIVVTAAKDAQVGWLPAQDELANLSTNSLHRVIQDVAHASLTEDAGGSAISVQAILDVVAAVRAGSPLVES
jgi:pimeloyl-ACP methyl ester carboxylesterase